ncbi:UDP-GLUCURONATE:XYLAN ALPHA-GLUCURONOSYLTRANSFERASE 1 [Salix koriyanagi]|uniref:Hexosyltransferase n=1 Tax=Salix koriyanagi TaxID=2511006 RepID=A0A9Q0SMS0_9ROSI|nr:UDP-GLUCURONATE:XYLAN ALPHA-GLUCURONOSYLTRANSFERASE 1 [Salix koriyanagi]
MVSFLYSPDVDQLSHSGSRQNFVNRWIWGGLDPRYVSDLDVNWDDVMKVIEKLGERNDYQGVGLLNFNNSEISYWKHLMPDATHVALQLDYADRNMTWDSLYPEWIDEEQEKEVPVCPSLPKPETLRKRLDLIAVKLPCRNEVNWSRDVARLHLQLAAANLAASAKGLYPIHLLFITERFPIPNLFTCKELVVREGNVWLYKPDVNVLRDKLQLPVGSCELSLPLQDRERVYSGNPQREAYATILHSAHVYVCGAIAAAQSIRLSGSTRDLVILVDETISVYHRSGLEKSGWKIRTIQRIRNPKAEKDAYNEWNYSKFRLWQLTDYDKIIFIDADLLILRNIDFLFGMPEISATGNNATLFNSGLSERDLYMVASDYDCNWNVDIFQEFASDIAHEKWWRVHDAMPEQLHQFCSLKSKQKAQLEYDRREAEKANYTDGHWKVRVQDRRLKKCIDNVCNWKSMLKHWGETNWTDYEFLINPSPPAISTASLSGLFAK